MFVTNEGTVIRTPVKDIPIYSRTATGVIVMRTAKDAKIVTIARVDHEEEEEKELSDNEIENEVIENEGAPSESSEANDTVKE